MRNLNGNLNQVMPQEGRKHQVRVHLHLLSSPMLLDPIYSDAVRLLSFIPIFLSFTNPDAVPLLASQPHVGM